MVFFCFYIRVSNGSRLRMHFQCLFVTPRLRSLQFYTYIFIKTNNATSLHKAQRKPMTLSPLTEVYIASQALVVTYSSLITVPIITRCRPHQVGVARAPRSLPQHWRRGADPAGRCERSRSGMTADTREAAGQSATPCQLGRTRPAGAPGPRVATGSPGDLRRCGLRRREESRRGGGGRQSAAGRWRRRRAAERTEGGGERTVKGWKGRQ